MRLYAPIFMLTRELTQEQTLHGHRLPAGTAVGVPWAAWPATLSTSPSPSVFSRALAAGTTGRKPDRDLRLWHRSALLSGLSAGALRSRLQFAQTWALGLARHRVHVKPLHPHPLAIRYAPFAQPRPSSAWRSPVCPKPSSPGFPSGGGSRRMGTPRPRWLGGAVAAEDLDAVASIAAPQGAVKAIDRGKGQPVVAVEVAMVVVMKQGRGDTGDS